MRSIRRSVPPGCTVNIPRSRYISGSSSVAGTLLPPARAASWKGKEKATEPQSEPHEAAWWGNGTSEHAANARHRISDFYVIKGLHAKRETTSLRDRKENNLSDPLMKLLVNLLPDKQNFKRKEEKKETQELVEALQAPQDALKRELSKNGCEVVVDRGKTSQGQGLSSRSVGESLTATSRADWPGENWKEDWGTDQLAQVLNHKYSKFIRFLPPPPRVSSKPEQRGIRPRTPKSVTPPGPYKVLSRRLLNMQEKQTLALVAVADCTAGYAERLKRLKLLNVDRRLEGKLKLLRVSTNHRKAGARTVHGEKKDTHAPIPRDEHHLIQRPPMMLQAATVYSKKQPESTRTADVISQATPDLFSLAIVPDINENSNRVDGKMHESDPMAPGSKMPSKKDRKFQKLVLKTREKLLLLITKEAPKVGKRKEAKAKRREKKAEVRQASLRGVLRPLPPNADVLEDVVSPHGPTVIPRLAHGLDRVLFNPSVHWVQDPHSRVYNFSPNVQSLPAVTDFAFERLKPFVSSSRDETLFSLALKHRKRFAGSTSSLTGLLSHIYFLISGDRGVDISTLSMAFENEPRSFTAGMRFPVAVVFRHRRQKEDENGGQMPTSTGDNQEIPGSSGRFHPLSSVGHPNSPLHSDSSDTVDPLPLLSARAGVEEKSTNLTAECVSSLKCPATNRPNYTTSDPTETTAELIQDGTLSGSPQTGEVGTFGVPNRPPPTQSSDSLAPDVVPPSATLHVTELERLSMISTAGVEHSPSQPVDSHSPKQHEAIVTPDDGSQSSGMHDSYAIDSSSSGDHDQEKLNVLIWLGTMAEKFLTLPEPTFEGLLRKNPVDESLTNHEDESYRYAKSSQFVMRSQLDCHDTRLPGTGVFDIKTRAVLPVRVDRYNSQENAGYLIRSMTGLYESFEREYYDLIRSAFLKYTFQARIGNMDGVFVAYHNTARVFGFQYVPVTEMEERIYGPGSPGRGAKIFEKCIRLLEILCDEVVSCFPSQSVSCTVEARQGAGNLKIWVVPSSQSGDELIAELTLTVQHSLNGDPVSSATAIDRADEDWDLHYSISRRTKPVAKIWEAYKAVQRREFASILPHGVSREDMAERLARVDYSAGRGLDLDVPAGISPKPEGKTEERGKFAKASPKIKHLRKLSRRGWDDLKQEDELRANQVVFSVGSDGSGRAERIGIRPGTSENIDLKNVDVDSPEQAPTLQLSEGTILR